MPELFVRVILPLPLHDVYTYHVPAELQQQVEPGKRVVVQFGKKKFYAALIESITNTLEEGIKPKEIIQVLDDGPVVLTRNLELWKWLASYYCAALGDVYKAALPSGLKLESKSKIYPAKIFPSDLNEKEKIILEYISEGITTEELQKKAGDDFSMAALHSLFKKNMLWIEEKISEKYKPKTKVFYKLNQGVNGDGQDQAIESLSKAKKQQRLLVHMIDLLHEQDDISQEELLKGTDFKPAQLYELVKKKLVINFEKQVLRVKEDQVRQVSFKLLNQFQESALNELKQQFNSKNVVLLHGVTASGKTEIYIRLIDETIKSGQQALYLVPEIALTTQIMERLKNSFGNKVGIYHSKLNSQERVEIWNRLLLFRTDPHEGYQVILGARSSIFMPFSNLGMIIVDEEHENSYKQFDPAPRYNARDLAVVLGLQTGARVLLGSATPSFESYHNAQSGKYGYVSLMQRHGDARLPEIIISDLKRAHKRKEMHSVLTHELYLLMKEALEKNEQVILFQNRRGYSPFVQCFSCGWIPVCKNCDVSLTYHKKGNRLSCHYCGYFIYLPGSCNECGSAELKTRGFGTEKIEDELRPLFRGARIARMDMDTTHSKYAFEKIIRNIEQHKVDILVGTQMVTKGLDFSHVSIVGILNADNLLNFPDFRAHERAYQLISQVAGRAGRKDKPGKVVIQTSEPEHPVIELLKSQDYHAASTMLMQERKLFRYPPFYRLMKVSVKHANLAVVNRAAVQLHDKLVKNRELIILGPEFPLISRIQLWYIKEIWIKINRKSNPDLIKQFVRESIEQTRTLSENSNVVVNVDVDPL